MQQLLKQSTAATTVVGPILDSTGAVYTGAAIGDLNITKNGTTAAMAAAATLTHDHNGHYLLVMTTGNTDTLGRLDITCNKSTYAMPPKVFEVLAAAAFDTLVTNGTLASTTSGRTIVTDAAGLVDANTVKLGPTGSGTAQTARDIGASVLLSSGTGTGQLDFTSGVVKANATQWLGGTIPAVNTTGVPLVDTKYVTGTPQTAKDIGALNVTNVNTLAGHDPGATLGTSTLTQSQVTGGAYSIQSASCVLGDARIANLDATVSSRGTSTLTQTQVTGGAYSVQSASCVLGDTRVANLDTTISSRLATVGYTAPDNTTIAAIAGYVDTEVAAIKAKTDNLPANPAAVGSAMTLTSGERDSIAAALLDLADGVETSVTVRKSLRAMAAALAGRRTNAGTATERYDAIANAGTSRIQPNADEDGNGTPTLSL
jgi:hypothetical protein